MVRLNAAFETLSRAEQRRAYDMWRAGTPRADTGGRTSGSEPRSARRAPGAAQRQASPESPPRRSRSRIGPWTLLLAVLAVGIVGLAVIGQMQSDDSSTPPTTARATVVPRTAATTPLRRSTPAPTINRSNAVTATPTRAQGAAPSVPTPRPTPAATRIATPTQAPTPVATRANTPTPVPTPAAAATAAPTPTSTAAAAATAAPTPTPTAAAAATAAPTPTPTAAAAVTAAPTATRTAAAAATAAPTSTRTAAAPEAFGDGVYLVPSELAPGTYRATDTDNSCRVYGDNSRLVASGPGRITFEVMPGWSSIRVRDCGTFELYSPSRIASFGDGVYLVPSELAPGTYSAADTSSRCDVYRDNVHPVASGPGRVTFEVQAAWSSIRVRDCGTFELHSPSRIASFGDGVYLVPSELAPGTYSAADTSSRCDVYRDNVHPVASGPGRVTFEVQAAWSSIRVRDCGTFELHSPSRIASFGDGVYLVPSEVAPGTYRAADTGSRCDVYRDNVHPVASGPGRVTFEVQAGWSSIRVRDCGTFELYSPSRITSPLSATVPTSCLPRSRREPTAPPTRAADAMSTATTSIPWRRPRTGHLRGAGRMVQHPGPRLRHLRTLLTEPHHLFRRRYLPRAFRGRAGNLPRRRHGQPMRCLSRQRPPVASGPGRVTFEVQAAWSSIRVRDCGTFELHSPSRIASFGDGVYLVPPNSHRVPTAPPTRAAGERCLPRQRPPRGLRPRESLSRYRLRGPASGSAIAGPSKPTLLARLTSDGVVVPSATRTGNVPLAEWTGSIDAMSTATTPPRARRPRVESPRSSGRVVQHPGPQLRDLRTPGSLRVATSRAVPASGRG